MLRRVSPTLFSTAARQICMKQCGGKKAEATMEEKEKQLDATIDAIRVPLLARLLSATPGYRTMMFPRIFHVSPEQFTQHLIRMKKFTKDEREAFANALCPDLKSLKALLTPLSDYEQRRVLDFVGLRRIMALEDKPTSILPMHAEHEFFLLSESLNSALQKVNLDYLFIMRKREQPELAATPPCKMEI